MHESQAKTLEYRFFPISPAFRFILYALLILIGLFFQFLAYFPGHSAVGLIIAALAGLLMIGSTYSKVPQDLGFEDWKPVTEKEFQRVMQNYALVRQAKIPVILRKKEGKTLFIVLAVFSFMFLGFFSIISSKVVFVVLAVDIAILLYPLFLSGHVTVHAPKELELKMDRFYAIMLVKDELLKRRVRITPYLRFDKDSTGNHIPEDVRFMLEPMVKPEDMVGIQLQITINNGPNGAVPYMYAVIICRGRDKSYQYLQNATWVIPGHSVTIEEGSEGEFAFLIVRQSTESGGYHTTGDDCTALAKEIAEQIYRLT